MNMNEQRYKLSHMPYPRTIAVDDTHSELCQATGYAVHINHTVFYEYESSDNTYLYEKAI